MTHVAMYNMAGSMYILLGGIEYKLCGQSGENEADKRTATGHILSGKGVGDGWIVSTPRTVSLDSGDEGSEAAPTVQWRGALDGFRCQI